MDFGELLTTLIPWVIPAILIYSFLLNSDIKVPKSGGNKGESKKASQDESSSKSDTGTNQTTTLSEEDMTG